MSSATKPIRNTVSARRSRFRFAYRLWLLPTLLALISSTLGAQFAPAFSTSKKDNPASAKLYAREEGGRLRVVLKVDIASGWHLYHNELGNPDAIGKPTTVRLGDDGVEVWSDLRFSEPEKLEQAGLGTWIFGHGGEMLVYAAGRLAEGGKLEDLTASIDGQTCEDSGVCLLYEEQLKFAGAGADELFATFPEDLRIDSPGGTEPGEAGIFSSLPDERNAGSADSTLFMRQSGERVELAIEVVIEPGWHLYHKVLGHPDAIGKATTVSIEADGIEFSDVSFPEPHKVDQPMWDAWIFSHSGRIFLTATGVAASGADVAATVVRIDGLTCSDESGTCVPYSEVLYPRGDGPAEAFAGFASGTDQTEGAGSDGGSADSSHGGEGTDSQGSSGDDKNSPVSNSGDEEGGILGFLGLAVFWGLVTLLMPCTYPMIPITISFFTKQAEQREGSALPLALAYGGGIVGIFIAIGVTVGPTIQNFANQPLFNLAVGFMFVFFAFALFGWVNLQPPRFLMNTAGKASGKGGLLGVFLMGLTLVITSFTCTAPFVGSLLASGADFDVWQIALGMGVFGLTMATPFVLLSLFPSRIKSMPNAGAWMNTLKVFLGFVELAASLKFFSTADLGWEWQLISKEVFLLGWGSTFLVAAAFLFGWINLKGEESGAISPGRMVAATATFLFGMYSIFLIGGYKMDPLMLAFAPPYSSAPQRASGVSAPDARTIVKDNYEDAVSQARSKHKALLVNFTGYN